MTLGRDLGTNGALWPESQGLTAAMGAAVSPPLWRHRPPGTFRCFSQLAAPPQCPLFRRHRGEFLEGRFHIQFLPLSPLRGKPEPRRSTARGTAAFAFLRWSASRRKRGRNGGGLDRATVRRWASIFLLAASIRKILAMQLLDFLAALVDQGGAAQIYGGGDGDGDGALGLLRMGLFGEGSARPANRTWKGALRLAAKAAAAAAAAAAIWLLLFGRPL